MVKSKDVSKFAQSVDNLEYALNYKKKAKKDRFFFCGISKSFEICLEYAWKHLKRKVLDEGLEAYSPKEVIKQAGKLKLIDNVEKWLKFIEDRNLAVHDYLGVSDEDYLKTIQEFHSEAKKLIKH